MKKINPISIINTTVEKIKSILEDETQDSSSIISKDLFEVLSNNGLHLLFQCKELDKDTTVVEALNKKYSGNSNTYFRTQTLFLSELIDMVLKNKNKSLQQEFVLAYYYDVLKNNRFASVDTLPNLSVLIRSDDFKKVVNNIISNNKISKKEKPETNGVLETLKELNHPKLGDFINHFKNFEILAQVSSNAEDEVAKEPNTVNNNKISYPPKEDSLEKTLEELNSLIGLDHVKEDIKELINLLKIQKLRTEEGLKIVDLTLHTVFLGPPGTGKTTVARLLGRIFKHLGFLSKGQLYESDRSDLIAGFVGQTAIKTTEVLNQSNGGVLFIDEAYALTQNVFGNDFGNEAVNTLIKRMEDDRADLAVIVAGYTKPMELFIESNPGLRSRFNRYFYFNHFSKEQLLEIFENFCKKSDFTLSEEAKDKLLDTFSLMEAHKTESFGNARVVRNIFEKAIQLQANRLVLVENLNETHLKEITEEDIPEPLDSVEVIKSKIPE